MKTKFYVNSEGFYVGAYVGSTPPDGSIEVPAPPQNSFQKWNGSEWILPDANKLTFAESQRKAAYNKNGCTIEELILALWRKEIEGDSTSADAIQAERLKIKAEYPYPT